MFKATSLLGWFLWASLWFAVRADTIVLRDGNAHRGTFVRGSDTDIRFRIDNGRLRTFDRNEVESIHFENDGVATIGSANREIFSNRRDGNVVAGEQGSMERRATMEIQRKYRQLGGGSSILGNPTSGVHPTDDGIGYYQHYSNGASIYWSPDTGAHEVHGGFRVKWAEIGWENSRLGYPTSDEQIAPDGRGRFQDFQGGRLLWDGSGAVQIRQRPRAFR